MVNTKRIIVYKEVNMNNEIIIFENQKVKLEVNMKGETVWLSLDQLAELFDRDKSVISRQYATKDPAAEPLPGPTGIS